MLACHCAVQVEAKLELLEGLTEIVENIDYARGAFLYTDLLLMHLPQVHWLPSSSDTAIHTAR